MLPLFIDNQKLHNAHESRLITRIWTNFIIVAVCSGYLGCFFTHEQHWPFVVYDMYSTARFQYVTELFMEGRTRSGEIHEINERAIPLLSYAAHIRYRHLSEMKESDPARFNSALAAIEQQANQVTGTDPFVKVWLAERVWFYKTLDSQPTLVGTNALE
ncbi:hypothetical protein BH10BDE1_BH10BDE1_20940 [soil metagenome]